MVEQNELKRAAARGLYRALFEDESPGDIETLLARARRHTADALSESPLCANESGTARTETLPPDLATHTSVTRGGVRRRWSMLIGFAATACIAAALLVAHSPNGIDGPVPEFAAVGVTRSPVVTRELDRFDAAIDAPTPSNQVPSPSDQLAGPSAANSGCDGLVSDWALRTTVDEAKQVEYLGVQGFYDLSIKPGCLAEVRKVGFSGRWATTFRKGQEQVGVAELVASNRGWSLDVDLGRNGVKTELSIRFEFEPEQQGRLSGSWRHTGKSAAYAGLSGNFVAERKK